MARGRRKHGLGHSRSVFADLGGLSVAPPVVTDQALDFGAKTLAGGGGAKIYDSGGAEVDLTSYDSLISGSLGAYTPVVSGGRLSFTGAAGAPDGAVLRCSHADGTVDVTVNEVANLFNVKDDAELEAAAESGTLAFADTISLRAGIYNPTKTDRRLRRSADPLGTWSGSNYVTITSENPLGAVIRRLGVDGSQNTNAYFEFTSIRFDCDLNGVDAAALRTLTGASYVYVHDCVFAGTANPARTIDDDICDAIDFNSTGGSNLRIEDCEFYDVVRPVTQRGPDNTCLRNYVRRFWGDCFQFVDPCARYKVSYNDVAEERMPYTETAIVAVTEGNPTLIEVADATGIIASYDMVITGATGLDEVSETVYNISNVAGSVLTVDVDTSAATPWSSGGVIRWTGAHGDVIQGALKDALAGELDDIEIKGNLFDCGASTPFLAGKQFIFLDDNDVDVDNLIIEGNLGVLGSGGGAGITVIYPANSTIRNNTIIRHLTASTSAEIRIVSPGANVTVANNVANGYSIGGAGTDFNNLALARTSIAYADAFVSHATSFSNVDTVAAYAPRTGGAIDALDPVPGAIPAQSFVSPFAFTPGAVVLVDPFIINGAYFRDPATAGAGVEIVEMEFKFARGATAWATGFFGGQVSSLALRTSDDTVYATAENSSDAEIANTTDERLTLHGDGVVSVLNCLWDFVADQLVVSLNGATVTRSFSGVPGDEIQSDRQFMLNTSNTGSVQLQDDLEFEYIRIWKTVGGTRTLHKDISVAAQGSIAGINADPWTVGTVLAG